MIFKNFETIKIIEKEILIERTDLLIISSNPVPSYFNLLVKYIFLIDICDYLNNQSTQKEIETINKLNYDRKKKNLFVIIFNTKLFKTTLEKQKNKDNKVNPKKMVSNILKDFSQFQVIEVEDLSTKNLTTIFKKIHPKKYKIILEKLNL